MKTRGGARNGYCAGASFAGRIAAAAFLCLCGCLVNIADAPTNLLPDGEPEGIISLPPSIPDPIEPVNRVVWAFNKGLLIQAINPATRCYRFVVPKPVRRGIGNFGRNLTFPGRLINNLLQARWQGAGDETRRFACNTTAGAAGFFDVATRWKIPKSDAGFGQTFGHWGWKPDCYLMLPVFGPSNDRDALGLAADTAANPLLYISPYKFQAGRPFSYLGPYTYFTYAGMFNEASDTAVEMTRFSRSEMDPYAELRFASRYAGRGKAAEYGTMRDLDEASLQTMKAILFTAKDPEFADRGKTRSVRIPSTGRRLPFTFWLQPGKAPVVYLLPGLGAHRLGKHSVALAELAYVNGFSVVCLSSAFHSEFMERASTASLPGYLPVDGHDVHAALTRIDAHLSARYHDRFNGRLLLGFSMGGVHALMIAATEAAEAEHLVKFDRFVALSPPARLLYAATKLDDFYQAPLQWAASERVPNMENAFLKAADLGRRSATAGTELAFGAVESQFLIGLSFRFVLRDIIFSSQRRANTGVLTNSIHSLRRAPVYEEIMHYSYSDYFHTLVVPHYQSRGGVSPAANDLKTADDLRVYESDLRANSKIRVILNRNDFLLAAEDKAWFQSTIDASRLTIFETGGHFGNLSEPLVQKTILGALSGSNPEP